MFIHKMSTITLKEKPHDLDTEQNHKWKQNEHIWKKVVISDLLSAQNKNYNIFKMKF